MKIFRQAFLDKKGSGGLFRALDQSMMPDHLAFGQGGRKEKIKMDTRLVILEGPEQMHSRGLESPPGSTVRFLIEKKGPVEVSLGEVRPDGVVENGWVINGSCVVQGKDMRFEGYYSTKHKRGTCVLVHSSPR